MKAVSNDDYRRILAALALLEYRPGMTLREQNQVRLGKLTLKKLTRKAKQ